QLGAADPHEASAASDAASFRSLPPHPRGTELAAECATGRWATRGPGTPSSAESTGDGRGSASDRRPEAERMRVVFIVAALLLSFPAVVGSAAGATAAAPQTA